MGSDRRPPLQSSRRASASTWNTRRRVQLIARAISSTLRPAARSARICVRRGGGLGNSTRSPPNISASFIAAPAPTARASASLAHGLCGTYRRVPPKLAISLAAASSPIISTMIPQHGNLPPPGFDSPAAPRHLLLPHHWQCEMILSVRSVLRTLTCRRRDRGATAADGFESKRSCAGLKRRRYTLSGQSRRRRARDAQGLTRGAIEMSLRSTFESRRSGGVRRLVRRRSQLTRDSVE